MKLLFIIGIIIGLLLVIYSIKKFLKLKNYTKTKAILTGYHSYNGRHDQRVTHVEFEVDKVKIECDLNYYSIFLKKGKKITIYYNPNKYYEIDCIYGNIFTLFLGILFILLSTFLILN